MELPRWQMSAPKDIDPVSAFLLLCVMRLDGVELIWLEWHWLEIYSCAHRQKDTMKLYLVNSSYSRRTTTKHQSQIKRNENKQIQPDANKPHILTVSIAKKRKWKKRVIANENGHELRLSDIKANMIAQLRERRWIKKFCQKWQQEGIGVLFKVANQ